MKTIKLLVLSLILGGSFGCQCSPLTECYCDGIDHIADHGPRAECLYHSKLDLTRINMPDGIHCCHGCCR